MYENLKYSNVYLLASSTPTWKKQAYARDWAYTIGELICAGTDDEPLLDKVRYSAVKGIVLQDNSGVLRSSVRAREEQLAAQRVVRVDVPVNWPVQHKHDLAPAVLRARQKKKEENVGEEKISREEKMLGKRKC